MSDQNDAKSKSLAKRAASTKARIATEHDARAKISEILTPFNCHARLRILKNFVTAATNLAKKPVKPGDESRKRKRSECASGTRVTPVVSGIPVVEAIPVEPASGGSFEDVQSGKPAFVSRFMRNLDPKHLKEACTNMMVMHKDVTEGVSFIAQDPTACIQCHGESYEDGIFSPYEDFLYKMTDKDAQEHCVHDAERMIQAFKSPDFAKNVRFCQTCFDRLRAPPGPDVLSPNLEVLARAVQRVYECCENDTNDTDSD